MPSWLKSATYILSVATGIIAAAQPQYAVILIPVSTFLAGFATTHPSDVPPVVPTLPEITVKGTLPKGSS